MSERPLDLFDACLVLPFVILVSMGLWFFVVEPVWSKIKNKK